MCYKTKSKSIRPKQCKLKKLDFTTASQFYEKYHYLGPRKAKIHLGIHHDDILVAVMSINTPSRQSKYDWEIVRMARIPEIRIHGLWSYVIKHLNKFGITGSIVSFSDNRLNSGNVYSKMGFELDTIIKSDYYYTDHHNRWHKSSLRKTLKEKQSNMTEKELRQKQNLWRIWDLGKKRWIKII